MTKILNKKIVYSWANCEEAEQYLGKCGYFSDGYYEDLKDWSYGELAQICPDNEVHDVFVSHEDKNEQSCLEYTYGLFLPADKAREEKTYRPFKDCAELCEYVRVTAEGLYAGLTLTIRNKENKIVRQVIVTEINYSKPFIALGVSIFDLEILFRTYEWQDEDTGDWHPFGVLEE